MGVGERFVKDDLWIISHENQIGEMIFCWLIHIKCAYDLYTGDSTTTDSANG